MVRKRKFGVLEHGGTSGACDGRARFRCASMFL